MWRTEGGRRETRISTILWLSQTQTDLGVVLVRVLSEWIAGKSATTHVMTQMRRESPLKMRAFDTSIQLPIESGVESAQHCGNTSRGRKVTVISRHASQVAFPIRFPLSRPIRTLVSPNLQCRLQLSSLLANRANSRWEGQASEGRIRPLIRGRAWEGGHLI